MSAEGNTQASGNPVTDHLEIWSSVYVKKATTGRGGNGKVSPYGIQKLRELILELAVRGKLVPQDPNDKPASVLLEKIAEKKGRLVKEGNIKKQKKISDIADEDTLFHCPAGWAWARLDQVAPMSLVDGDWIETKDQDPSGWVRLIQLADVGVDEFKNVSQKFVNEATCKKLKCTELEKGDVLIARLPNPIGRACLFPGLDQPAITVVDVAILRPFGFIHDRYLIHAINSTSFREQVESFGKGATRFRIATGKLKTILIPIPPLAEQHRIVAKVDELMTLCDQLEQQQIDSLQAHQTLVETLLRTLVDTSDDEQDAQTSRKADSMSGATAQNSQQAWNCIAEHFDTLFTTEESIDQLEQTILQLAVIGKLVPQDPNNEPSSVLLEKIAEEKAQLVKDKKIRKQKALPEIADAEISHVLPVGWAFARLQNVIDVRDGTHDSPKDALGENTYPLVTSKNFRNGDIEFENARRISETDHLEISKRSLVEKHDILFSMIGGNLGNQVMVKDDREFSIKNVALFKYYNREMTSPFFVKKYMEHLALNLQAKAIGGAQPFVSLGFLRSLVIALPPVEEQHRIVAKVDELMSLCDILKARIQGSQTIQTHLADAIVEQAVG